MVLQQNLLSRFESLNINTQLQILRDTGGSLQEALKSPESLCSVQISWIGEQLLELQRLLGGDFFKTWVDAELEIDLKTARDLMGVAKYLLNESKKQKERRNIL